MTCLLIPIISIGLYPKLATNAYDLKTAEVASKVRAVLPVIVQQQESANLNHSSLNAHLVTSLSTTATIAPQISTYGK